jgi:hypothetical protein
VTKLTSKIDNEHVVEGTPSTDETLGKLRAHISTLESKLAPYTRRYNLTDRVRKF